MIPAVPIDNGRARISATTKRPLRHFENILKPIYTKQIRADSTCAAPGFSSEPAITQTGRTAAQENTMATPAQIIANRGNATLSTGPKTNEGKQASSRNATRHGLAGS